MIGPRRYPPVSREEMARRRGRHVPPERCACTQHQPDVPDGPAPEYDAAECIEPQPDDGMDLIAGQLYDRETGALVDDEPREVLDPYHDWPPSSADLLAMRYRLTTAPSVARFYLVTPDGWMSHPPRDGAWPDEIKRGIGLSGSHFDRLGVELGRLSRGAAWWRMEQRLAADVIDPAEPDRDADPGPEPCDECSGTRWPQERHEPRCSLFVPGRTSLA